MWICRYLSEVFCHLLSSNSAPNRVDASLSHSLIQNALPYQRLFFNILSRKLYSLTMTAVYLLPIVLNHVAHLFLTKNHPHIHSTSLIRTFYPSIATLYGLPCPVSDSVPFETFSSFFYKTKSMAVM